MNAIMAHLSTSDLRSCEHAQSACSCVATAEVPAAPLSVSSMYIFLEFLSVMF